MEWNEIILTKLYSQIRILLYSIDLNPTGVMLGSELPDLFQSGFLLLYITGVESSPDSRTEEDAEEEQSSSPDEDTDVRLSEGLRALFGKRRYVKKREISRAHLMRYLCDKGEITEVSLLHVDIEVSLIIFIQSPWIIYDM